MNGVGRFGLSFDFLDNITKGQMLQIFTKVIIYKAETNVLQQMVVYEGRSDYFRKVGRYEQIPWYRLIFETNEDEILFMHHTRIKFEEAISPVYIGELPKKFGKGTIEIPFGYKLVSKGEHND
ncbi:MAG: hypothetical protein ACW98D_16860 [Promethearchaeota archaeon]|jgi:hypothetical protein